MHEAVEMKPKVQGRPEEFGDTRDLKCLPSKAVGRKQNEPKRKAV